MKLLDETPLLGAEDVTVDSWRMLIAGEWSESATGGKLDVYDPGTGERLCRVPDGGREDVDRAVLVARETFEEGRWHAMPAYERSRILWRVADLIDENASKLATLESLNQGMPVTKATGGVVPEVARCFRYYAGWADKLGGRSGALTSNGRDFHTYTSREPIGVVGLIIPWNSPLLMAAWKLAPALAAGCSCVLKPAEETPVTALWLGELLLAAGVPPGVVNIVTGRGETAGAALAAHDDVDKIAFTGSTEVGRLIVSAATGNLKKVTLELGGKSPVVVFDDANLDQAITGAAAAIFSNSGQVCTAGSRLFVQRPLYERVVQGVADIAKNLSVGYCMDPKSELGPLVSEAQRQRVMGYIESGVSEGASLVVGGDATGRGYFVSPTVMVDAQPSMRAVREEIFGPVVAAMEFDDLDEVAAAANSTSFGLAASVWTRDISKAHGMARRLRAGRVGINVHGLPDVTMPTGGYKQSGWGRELGPEGLDAYLETKSVFTLVH